MSKGSSKILLQIHKWRTNFAAAKDGQINSINESNELNKVQGNINISKCRCQGAIADLHKNDFALIEA